jgi:transposase
MRQQMPTMTESAAELLRRMKSEPDLKKRQRLQALYWVASGQTRHRQDVAAALGVHRHRVAAWFTAYAQGGIEHALSDHVPRPPMPRRITETALTALKARWHTPTGFPSDGHLRTWLAEQHQVQWSYSSVYAFGRGALRAKPKRPRPSHAKKVRSS